MLLYAAAREDNPIRAGVTICSPASFSNPTGLHRLGRGTRWLVAGRGRLPQRSLARALGGGRYLPVWGMLASRKNMDWSLGRGLALHALVDLPRPMAREVVDWLREETLTDSQGRAWLPEDSDIPLLVLGASVDRMATPTMVEDACGAFRDCEFRLLGTEGGLSTELSLIHI